MRKVRVKPHSYVYRAVEPERMERAGKLVRGGEFEVEMYMPSFGAYLIKIYKTINGEQYYQNCLVRKQDCEVIK